MTTSPRGTIASSKNNMSVSLPIDISTWTLISMLCPTLSTRTSFAFRPVNSTSCILRAIVNPSHRSPDNLHKAWVAVKSKEQIPSECNWGIVVAGQISTVRALAHFRRVSLHYLCSLAQPNSRRRESGYARLLSMVVRFKTLPLDQLLLCDTPGFLYARVLV